jgi:ribosomal protein S17
MLVAASTAHKTTGAVMESGASAQVTHDIVINDQPVFKAGDVVTVEAVSPNDQRPEYKYVVTSARTGARFQLSDADMRESVPVGPPPAAVARCAKCGKEYDDAFTFCPHCAEPKMHPTQPIATSSDLKVGTLAKVTKMVRVGSQVAFSPGDVVIIEDIKPHKDNPDWKYVVKSEVLNQIIHMGTDSLVVAPPGSVVTQTTQRSQLKKGGYARLTQNVTLGNKIAFKQGDTVQIKDIKPHLKYPEKKYVVMSPTLRKRVWLEESSLRAIPADAVAKPTDTSSDLKAGTLVKLTHTVRLGSEVAFRPDDVVKITRIKPDKNNLDAKYVLRSKLLKQYINVSGDSLVAAPPGSRAEQVSAPKSQPRTEKVEKERAGTPSPKQPKVKQPANSETDKKKVGAAIVALIIVGIVIWAIVASLVAGSKASTIDFTGEATPQAIVGQNVFWAVTVKNTGKYDIPHLTADTEFGSLEIQSVSPGPLSNENMDVSQDFGLLRAGEKITITYTLLATKAELVSGFVHFSGSYNKKDLVQHFHTLVVSP